MFDFLPQCDVRFIPAVLTPLRMAISMSLKGRENCSIKSWSPWHTTILAAPIVPDAPESVTLAQVAANPEQYERFKDERSRPFWDLLELVKQLTDAHTNERLSRGGPHHMSSRAMVLPARTVESES